MKIKKRMGLGVVMVIFLLNCKLSLSKRENKEIVEAEVKGVTVDVRTNTPVVILEEKKNKRLLPIWIGFLEARAIAMELEAVKTPRPMTHDLMKDIMEGLEAGIERVIVTELKNETFYAVIQVKFRKRSVNFDSRPSDAIALALRFKSPIYVSKQVLDTAQTLTKPPEGWEDVIMGFSVQEMSPEIAEAIGMKEVSGLLVSDVRPGSTSERDGLRRGDVIISANGRPVDSLKALAEIISMSENKPMSLRVFREDKEIELQLHPGEVQE